MAAFYSEWRTLRPFRNLDSTRGVALTATLAAVVAACFPLNATAGIAGMQRVATGLSQPVFATHAPGDPNRLFIVQRAGTIRILNLTTGTLEPTPFLNVPDTVAANESGLLGLAFHPQYETNGKFYVYVTADNGGIVIDDGIQTPIVSPVSSHVREYTVSANPNIANTQYDPVLSMVRPSTFHLAGWMGFSPVDNLLYVASGDGGHARDEGPGHTFGMGNAQDLTDNLMGKILRIDVNGDDFTQATPEDMARNYAIPPTNPYVGETGDDEIWANGLRNPYRASFDRATGDLWIGDVGQGAREEIDYIPSTSPGGENFGWRLREGSIPTPTSGGISVGGDRPPGNVDPVHDFVNPGVGSNGVVGGYVYRGPDPSLQGQYFFSDLDVSGNGRFWTLDSADLPTIPGNPPMPSTDVEAQLKINGPVGSFPVSYGEDLVGNMYIVYYGGSVYCILTDELTPGDFNADAEVDGDDLAAWKAGYGDTTNVTAADGDADDDGDVDGADFLTWQRNVGWSPLDIPTVAASAAVPEPASVALLFFSLMVATVWRMRMGAILAF